MDEKRSAWKEMTEKSQADAVSSIFQKFHILHELYYKYIQHFAEHQVSCTRGESFASKGEPYCSLRRWRSLVIWRAFRESTRPKTDRRSWERCRFRSSLSLSSKVESKQHSNIRCFCEFFTALCEKFTHHTA